MQCLKPLSIGNPQTGEQMIVGCGKCVPCRGIKAGSWTIRLLEHIKCTNVNKFITLTLNDEHLTYGSNSPVLLKRDLQLFFKKLRKYFSSKLTYYAVGEYGERYKRPHYHVILFNLNEKDDYYIYNAISESWKDEKGYKGFIHIGDVNEASIRYVAGYLEKGILGEKIEEKIVREFSLMSKNLGINYIKNNKNYHEKNKSFIYRNNGFEKTLPRYYREKIFSKDDLTKWGETIRISLGKKTIKEEQDEYDMKKYRILAKKQLKPKRYE